METFKLVKVEMTAPGDTSRTIRTREDEEVAASDESARIFVFFLDDYNVRLGNSMAARKPVADFIRTQLVTQRPRSRHVSADAARRRRPDAQSRGVVRVIERFEGRKFRYEPRNDIEQRYAQLAHRDRRADPPPGVAVGAEGPVGQAGRTARRPEGDHPAERGLHRHAPAADARRDGRIPGLGNPAAGNPLAGENNLAEERAPNMARVRSAERAAERVRCRQPINTAIYAVDPRGLSTGEFDIQDNIGPRLSQDALRSTMATLHALAENTDGRAIVNRNDLAKGMEQIVRDSSAYYLLGYSSTQAPQDGKFHEIRVRMKRPGITGARPQGLLGTLRR